MARMGRAGPTTDTRGADTSPRRYTLGEEIANAITHGIGWAGSIAGLVALVAVAIRRGSALRVTSVTVYGLTMVMLYVASTMYHALADPKAKRVFKIIDHASIYLLIAGSYTPFTLITLKGPWGWGLFGFVWALAVVGVLMESLPVEPPKWVSMVIYLGMGWLVIVAIRPLLASLPVGGLALLASGGVVYTAGVVFYGLKRVRYMHTVWHLFVLLGSLLQFLAVLFYVV